MVPFLLFLSFYSFYFLPMVLILIFILVTTLLSVPVLDAYFALEFVKFVI